jgi:threonine dehydrogenase-like Zn-dependent dehydrogenase
VLAGLSNHVLVVGKHDSKLALLRARGIATAKLGTRWIRESADVVVDCTGSATGLPTALKLVRPRGTIVLKTTVAGSQDLAWAPFVIDEVTLVGSRCGPFDRAIKGWSEAKWTCVRCSPTGSTSRRPPRLARAQEPGVLKVLWTSLRIVSGPDAGSASHALPGARSLEPEPRLWQHLWYAHAS